MAENEEKLKCLFMKVKEKSEKVGLKINIQKKKITASSSIISWQIDGETGETVADLIFFFFFFELQNHLDGHCSHEIKRHLHHGREVMTNLDSMLKNRDITLPTRSV